MKNEKKKLSLTVQIAIGLVLGELAEINLRRSLMLSKGSIAIFFTRPVSLCIILVAAFMLFAPIIKKLFAKIKAKKADKTAA